MLIHDIKEALSGEETQIRPKPKGKVRLMAKKSDSLHKLLTIPILLKPNILSISILILPNPKTKTQNGFKSSPWLNILLLQVECN